MQQALIVGGDSNAEKLGYDLGELVWQVGTAVFGATDLAKGAAYLAKAGISLSAAGISALKAASEAPTLPELVIYASKDSAVQNASAAAGAIGAKGGVGATTAEEYVNILSPAERQHILFGDGPGSGGHMYPGQPGKTTFPQNWTEGQILHNVGDVVTSPTTQWYAQTETGGALTKAGDPAKWVAWETRDGVSMRVVYEPATGRTVTAFPDSAPTTINLKAISK